MDKMGKPGYIGSISNDPSQFVEAPVKPAHKGGKPTVHKGGDLRSQPSKG